jgi:hypothetical protein
VYHMRSLFILFSLSISLKKHWLNYFASNQSNGPYTQDGELGVFFPPCSRLLPLHPSSSASFFLLKNYKTAPTTASFFLLEN